MTYRFELHQFLDNMTVDKTADDNFNILHFALCLDTDHQHYRGHQQFMGKTHPHRGPAEERDGDPEHNNGGPPSEGLGAIHDPEEPHDAGR